MKFPQMPPQRNPPPPRLHASSTASPAENRSEAIQETVIAPRSAGGEKAHCTVTLNSEPIKSALRSLEHIFELAPEVVQGFLNGIDSLSQLVRIHRDDRPTGGAGEVRISLEPADLLADFLAAFPAGNVE